MISKNESIRNLQLTWIFVTLCDIWYHLYNLKKREKHP